MENGLYREQHVVSARDFDRVTLNTIFSLARHVKARRTSLPDQENLLTLLKKTNGAPVKCIILHKGPSTRTVGSFELAIQEAGGFVSTKPLTFSSFEKGEDSAMTAVVLGNMGWDVIIIRNDDEPDAAKAMADAVTDEKLKTIIINAGDGQKEHPTQMLLDLYTVWELREKLLLGGNLTIALVGDLSRGRTIHSLLLGLRHYGGTVFLVGPENENIPPWLSAEMSKTSLHIIKTEDAHYIAPLVNVWYFTRLQTNLANGTISEEEVLRYAEQFGASEVLRKNMRADAIALHPLPHRSEYPNFIHRADPRFIHLDQVKNSVPVRMALLYYLQKSE